MTFHEKFLWLARDRGVSPRAVALELGFDPSAPAQWKRRGGRPSPEISKQLADYFGVSVDELLDDARELEQVAAEREVARQLGMVKPDPRGDYVLGSQAVRDVAWLEAVEKNLQAQRSGLETLIGSVSAQLALARDRVQKEKTLAPGKKR